jgi:hypothetical protein
MKLLKLLMLPLCLFFFSVLNAQNYEKEWKLIDSLTNKGLPESALKETESLMEKIRKDNTNKNQTALFIKVLVYFNKFQTELEENGLEKAIYRFQTETETMKAGPAKAIMQSMLAEMYTQYLNNHIYKLRDRTAVADAKPEDISTWDIPLLTDKVFELYSMSLSNPDIKNVKLSDYIDILSGSLDEKLEPTLFDLIVNRAIGFYANENSYLAKPAYRFYIEQSEALGDAQVFMNYRFTAKDSLSNKFRCLLMYQELLRFHAADQDPQAFLNADFRRLTWVRSQAVISDKDAVYLNTLNGIAQKYASHSSAAEALYMVAAWHEEQGGKYKPSPEQTHRWDFKKAKELSEDIIKKYPQSFGASQAISLISRIEQRSIGLTVEAVNPIGKPILGNLSTEMFQKPI